MSVFLLVVSLKGRVGPVLKVVPTIGLLVCCATRWSMCAWMWSGPGIACTPGWGV